LNIEFYTQASLVHKQLELGNKRQQKIEGILLRSRANWHENGEKCSEYFCKLEKKNFIKKTITELIDENGQHITDPSEILLSVQKYSEHFSPFSCQLARDLRSSPSILCCRLFPNSIFLCFKEA
jgi:hypothetical protein